jgi:hypothetical protein
MPSFDKDKFAKTLNDNALPPFGQGKCARYVRLAIEAAGGNTAGHPISAKDWGPTLARIGCTTIAQQGYIAQKGDIAVIQATSKSPHGHIQGHDGTRWISDFIQSAFWPGPSFREEKPSYEVYRYPF